MFTFRFAIAPRFSLSISLSPRHTQQVWLLTTSTTTRVLLVCSATHPLPTPYTPHTPAHLHNQHIRSPNQRPSVTLVASLERGGLFVSLLTVCEIGVLLITLLWYHPIKRVVDLAHRSAIRSAERVSVCTCAPPSLLRCACLNMSLLPLDTIETHALHKCHLRRFVFWNRECRLPRLSC